jgi:hypothetical protein
MSTLEENIVPPRHIVFESFIALIFSEIVQGLKNLRRATRTSGDANINRNMSVDQTSHSIRFFEDFTTEKIGHAYFLM